MEVKKLFLNESEKIKSVDLHPTEPWVLSSTYEGKLIIHDYDKQSQVISIDVLNQPIRSAAFITRKQWIVCGCDDKTIRVYNYNTLERLKMFTAHNDFIRNIAIHPTQSFVLSCSDDNSIKLWDWDLDWMCVKEFKSHIHYVMMVKWNPKDLHIFASCSLDRTIKIWGTQNTGGTGSVIQRPHFTLSGHKSDVYCIEYSTSGDRSYIISGSDDNTVRVWDYQTRQCVQVLTGHKKGVHATVFTSHLPYIISGSEDGTIQAWNSITFGDHKTYTFLMDKVWSLSTTKNSNIIAMGCDKGTLVLQWGSDKPIASLKNSKLIWAKGSDLMYVNLKLIDFSVYKDGESLDLNIKPLGNCEIFPRTLSHHPSGRFIAMCDKKEYNIQTAQALRNKSYGTAVDFVWAYDGSYATHTISGRITIFHNFEEQYNFTPSFTIHEMFGGQLIGITSSDYIYFYDWQDFRLIRRVNVAPTNVWWSDNGQYVCLACENSFYILRYCKEHISAVISAGGQETDEGILDAFELITEVKEKIETGVWVSSNFVFITNELRLQIHTNDKIERIALLERPMFILGYLTEQDRLCLIDLDYNVYTYQLGVSVIEFKNAIAHNDLELAEQHFNFIPKKLHNKIANFLDQNGYPEKAFEITTDVDDKFDLAIRLNLIDTCLEIIHTHTANSSVAMNNTRWKQLGDKAFEEEDFEMAIKCYEMCKEVNLLFLIYTATGDAHNLTKLAEMAMEMCKYNVAFQSYFLLQDVDRCIEVLTKSQRYSEAAIFSLTYAPSRVEEIVQLWKEELSKTNPALAQRIATPSNSDLFPDFNQALEAEKALRNIKKPISSTYYSPRPVDEPPFNFMKTIKSDGLEKALQALQNYTFHTPPSAEITTSTPTHPHTHNNDAHTHNTDAHTHNNDAHTHTQYQHTKQFVPNGEVDNQSTILNESVLNSNGENYNEIIENFNFDKTGNGNPIKSS